MDKKPEWIKIDQTHYQCPRCDGIQDINRPSGKETEAEWNKRLEGRLLEHMEEHERRDKLSQADDDSTAGG
jgi:hypothetical protein